MNLNLSAGEIETLEIIHEGGTRGVSGDLLNSHNIPRMHIHGYVDTIGNGIYRITDKGAKFLKVSTSVSESKPESASASKPKGLNPKDQIGATKVPLSLVPYTSIMCLAMALQEGATRYSPFNWREIPVQSHIYLEAAVGHVMALLDGQDIDPASGLHHASKAMACVAIYLDALMTGNLVESRPTLLPRRSGSGTFSRDPLDAVGDPERIKKLIATPWLMPDAEPETKAKAKSETETKSKSEPEPDHVACPTCKDEGKILSYYSRGPDSPMGNQYVGCPNCDKGRRYSETVKNLLMGNAQALLDSRTSRE